MCVLYCCQVRHGAVVFVRRGEVRDGGWVAKKLAIIRSFGGMLFFVRDPSFCRLTRHQLIPTYDTPLY